MEPFDGLLLITGIRLLMGFGAGALPLYRTIIATMHSFRKTFAVFLVIFGTALAQAVGASGGDEHSVASNASHPHDSHELAVFIGGATRHDDGTFDDTGMAISLEYEYRFAPKFGVGAVVEWVVFADEHRDFAFAVPLFWHPLDGLILSAGPGFETDGGHETFLVRFGVAYLFHVRNFTLSPIVSLSMTSGANTLVYGFAIGRGF